VFGIVDVKHNNIFFKLCA